MNITIREQQYHLLQQDYKAGKMDEAAFVTAVDRLGFQDPWGRYWMLGLQTGLWYYYNGQAWQQANPGQITQLSVLNEPERSWQRDSQKGDWRSDQSETDRWMGPGPTHEPSPVSGQKQTNIINTGPSQSRPGTEGSLPANLNFSSLFAVPTRSILVVSVAFMVIFALLVWPVGSAPPTGGPALAPSPRPPLGGGSSGGGGGDEGNGDSNGNGGAGPQSAIVGTLTDLSTGLPGAGLEISVNGQIVRTDTDGSYSITGLSAGEYAVSPELKGRGQVVQGAVYVYVNGQESVTVDLAYYSQPQPLPTDTPQASTVAVSPADPPPSLPDSGGSIGHDRPLIIAGIGLLLALAGGILYHFGPLKITAD